MTRARPLVRIVLAMAAILGAWILATPPSGGADEPAHVVRSAALVRGKLDAVPITEDLDGFELPGHVGFPDPVCFAFEPNVSASCLAELEAVEGTALRPTRSVDYPIWGHLAPGLGSFLPEGWSSTGARAADALIPMMLLGGALFAAARHGWGAASGVLLAISVPVWFIVAVVNPSGLAIAGGVAVWVGLANGTRGRPGLAWHPSRLDQALLAAGWVALALPRRDGLVYAAVIATMAILIFDLGVGHLRRSIARPTWAAIAVSTLVTLAWATRSSTASSKLLFVAPLAPVAAIGARWLWRRAGATVGARVSVAAAGALVALIGSFVVMSTRVDGFDATVLQQTIGQTGIDLRETIGLVGWLDTAVPQSMVFLWLIGLGVLVGGAVIAERTRALVGTAAILVVGVWMSWVLTMVQNDASGTYWQGRYYLPLLVGVPIVLSTAAIARRDARRLGKVAAGATLVVANVGIAAAMRRWGVGEQGTLVPWNWDTYDTVVPPVALLGLHGLGTVALWRSVDVVADVADVAVEPVAQSVGEAALADGVNLLGYHSAASGLGVAVRRVHESMVAAGIPVSVFDVDLTDSPSITPSAGVASSGAVGDDDRPVRSTTIAVVTAPELPAAFAAHPALGRVDRVVGYWFWEVASVPAGHDVAFDLVDEVWAPTTFVADAYRQRAGAPPVVHQPLLLPAPIVEADASNRWRSRLAPDGEFVLLVALDLFSIVERKNPFAAIEAFTQVAARSERAVRLVIKTLNGDRRPESLRRITDMVASSAAGDRIDVIDEFVSDRDMIALIDAADCLVSLHRGEGLGLHLADAMWVGTPVIATRYSGNLDFMDDENSLLVDADLVAAQHGEGAYPSSTQWAEPRVTDAIDHMLRLIEQPAESARLVRAARSSMALRPSAARLGAAYGATIQQLPGMAVAPTPDFNDVLHQLRTEALADMPTGVDRMLSVGCAGRWYFDWIEDAYGMVIEHVGIEYFSPKPDDLPGYVTWIVDTASNMASIDDSTADLLVSGQNIEHLWPADVVGFLSESNRVVRPGGSIVIDSPNRIVTERLGWSQPEHTIEFTADEITELLGIAGFAVSRIVGLWDCAGFGTLEPRSTAEAKLRARPVEGNRIDDAFVWWVEAERVGSCDGEQLSERVEEIFAVAWPERLQRFVVNERAARSGDHVALAPSEAGVIVHGPHTPLSAGHYEVGFEVMADGAAGDVVGACIVQAGERRLGVVDIVSTGRSEVQNVVVPIDFDEMTFGVHGRVDATGVGRLSAIPTITVRPERPVGH